jgi:hypothetical protein
VVGDGDHDVESASGEVGPVAAGEDGAQRCEHRQAAQGDADAVDAAVARRPVVACVASYRHGVHHDTRSGQ